MKFERRCIKSKPIKWTEEEEKKLNILLKSEKVSIGILKEEFPLRTSASIRSKIRKVRIREDLFGSSYREVKKEFTNKIALELKPASVFDAYAGVGHQTFEWIKYASTVYACEIAKNRFNLLYENALKNGFSKVSPYFDKWISLKKDDKVLHLFNGDAIKATAYISVFRCNIDIVDLDTCGSTILTIPIYLNMLKPEYMVITHGEFHSYRFGREDVLRRSLCHKDITSSSFSVNDLEVELEKAVKTISIRSHNEIKDSFYPKFLDEIWLGKKSQGMLRRLYQIEKPRATSDCLNELLL